MDIGFVFHPTLRPSNLFPFKDRVPFGLRSYVVYLFKCQCYDALYVCQTCRHLHTRILDLMGISALIGKKFGNHSLSAIFHHHCDIGHPLTPNDFSILTSSSTSFELFLRESLLINKLKPTPNATIGSYPLSLFWITNYGYFNFKPFVILNGNLLLRHL